MPSNEVLIQAPLQFSRAEWREVYYALQQRVHTLDDHQMDKARLRRILEEIGVEGILAAQYGVSKEKRRR